MLTDTVVEDTRWQALGLADLAETAAQATLAHLGLDAGGHEIAVLGCDDARIAVLNADFRDKPQPTNVLSWPSQDRAAPADGAMPDLPLPADPGEINGWAEELGDIAISFDTCADEATAAGKPLTEHVTHLIVHATLHLLGFDHVRDLDATLMEQTETAILGKLGLPDPYTL